MTQREPSGSEKSTTEANKDLVRRLDAEVFNEGNLDVIDELVAEEYVLHDPLVPEEMRGPEGLRGQVEMLRTAFPDLSTTEEEMLAEGDTVAYRWTAQGTHEGTLMNIEPTGATVEVAGMETNRIENGKIVETRLSYDTLGMMQQLGVIPEEPDESAPTA